MCDVTRGCLPLYRPQPSRPMCQLMDQSQWLTQGRRGEGKGSWRKAEHIKHAKWQNCHWLNTTQMTERYHHVLLQPSLCVPYVTRADKQTMACSRNKVLFGGLRKKRKCLLMHQAWMNFKSVVLSEEAMDKTQHTVSFHSCKTLAYNDCPW